MNPLSRQHQIREWELFKDGLLENPPFPVPVPINHDQDPLPSWMNRQAWRKFKQAEKNMKHNFFRRDRSSLHRRRSQYWAGEFLKWLEKIGI